MGYLINSLRRRIESSAGESNILLWMGGLFITLIVVLISSLTGYFIEQLAFSDITLIKTFATLSLILGLASSLAANDLRKNVLAVIETIPTDAQDKSQSLDPAREKLKHIVGREVKNLNKAQILRATAETASENSVDGIFAPLFWIFVGAGLWHVSTSYPGPLSLAWAFKASSTIDSMIGYKRGKLLWLGAVGAKLDDALAWIPSRLVFISLPVTTKPFNQLKGILRSAWLDGVKDNSPNSGLSEAIFAHCVGIRMGGINEYQGGYIRKPILAKHAPAANAHSIKKLMNISLRLELFWLGTFCIFSLGYKIIF